MKNNPQDRPDGWYFVRLDIDDPWSAASWWDGKWFIAGDEDTRRDVYEVGPRIPMPDEQKTPAPEGREPLKVGVCGIEPHARALTQQCDELLRDRSLDTDRLEWLASEVTELWFGGKQFDIAKPDELRQEIDAAARKHLCQLKTKLESLDAARAQGAETR